MGWRCDCILGLRDVHDPTKYFDMTLEVLDAFEEIPPKNAGLFQIDGTAVDAVTVWDIEPSLRQLSKCYPQYILELWMRDPVGDQHMQLYWRGLMYEIEAQVTFEPFDWTKLEPEILKETKNGN